MTDNEIKEMLEDCGCPECTAILDLINRQKAEIERLESKVNELKNGFFQEHYKEIECQELLSVKEAWRKESLHNIDLEAEIERLNKAMDAMVLEHRRLIKTTRAEAIKELEKRAKILVIPQKTAEGYTREIILKSDFDNLVKEMTEGATK